MMMTQTNTSQNDAVCPYWLAFTLDNPIRRLIHKPEKILAGLVKAGQTVMDLGCGPGTFSLEMARLVGDQGRVIVVDLQKQMLERVRSRAKQAGLISRFVFQQATPERIGVSEKVDFVLAFWMMHEVPDQRRLLEEVKSLINPGGHFLLVEPILHVTGENFQKTIQLATRAGLTPVEERNVRISRGMLFQKRAD
jgi:ubiquinone/menaquinone biosynthesis C-methylase UbiE